MSHQYTTLLFDNDGVLVDSEDLSYQAFADAFTELGKEFTEQDYRTLILEQGAHVTQLMQHFEIPTQHVQDVLQRVSHHFITLLEEQCQLMPKVHDTLLKLHQQYCLVVVTGSTRQQFEAAHTNKSTLHLFKRVFALEDYQDSKPSPAPYLTALKTLGLTAQECLVIEDTKRGLMSAMAAGIDCAVIPHHLTKQHDFSGAKWILNDFEALQGLLL